MSHLPTPITREVECLAAAIESHARIGRCYDGADLQRVADHLFRLARRTAPVERFHAEMVAEATAEELRQGPPADDVLPGAEHSRP